MSKREFLSFRSQEKSLSEVKSIYQDFSHSLEMTFVMMMTESMEAASDWWNSSISGAAKNS